MNLSNIISLKKQIKRIAFSHGATSIAVFGSYARGHETEKSDVDFLITLAPKKSLLDIVAIKQDLEDFWGKTVDIATDASLSPYLKDDILSERVLL